MGNFKDALLSQIDVIFSGIPEYFKQSPISTIFLIFLVVVLCLNIVKRVLIRQVKKRGTTHQACKSLLVEQKGQDCGNPSYREYFKQYGCENCKGRFFGITDAQAEEQIASDKIWKRIIFILAIYGKGVLPYITFVYTLSTVIFESRK